jgi:hypothetical protein
MTWQATVRAGGSFKRRGHDQALFRNLPLGESDVSTIPAPPQGFANLRFSSGKIGPKQTQIA